MYTQCPECLSIYEITKEQLRQSRGRVECGVCGTRFSAQVRLAESLKSPIFERPGKSATPDKKAVGKPTGKKTRADTASAPHTQPSSKTPAQKPAAKPAEKRAPASTKPAPPKATATAPTVQRRALPPKPGPEKPANAGADDLSDWALATLDANAGMEPLISPREQAERDARERAERAKVPGVLDKVRRQRWGWLIPALVVIATLAFSAQIIWLTRVPLSGVPVLGRLVLPWCGGACRADGTEAMGGNWQIADRRIQPHPNVDGVILVEVTIRNASDQATAYPAVRLRLYGDNQDLVAERTLLPDAYMQELRPGDRLPAGALLPLSVALEAPRMDWTNYEIELLPSIVL